MLIVTARHASLALFLLVLPTGATQQREALETVTGAPTVGNASQGLSAGGKAQQVPGFQGKRIQSGLSYPTGQELFDRLDDGQSVVDIRGWSIERQGPLNSFIACGSRQGNARSLHIDDANAAPVDNRVKGPQLTAPEPRGYRWGFRLKLNSLPPAGVTQCPAIVFEHPVGTSFEEVFGLELTPTGGRVFVTGFGGLADTVDLFQLGNGVGLGGWIDVRLELDLKKGRILASANGGTSVELELGLPSNLDAATHRFAYRGDGVGNVMDLEIDDLAVQFLLPADPLLLAFDFEGLANGTDLRGDEFSRQFLMTSNGPNVGLALFDSTVGGPNTLGPDPDLLVDRGNLLILQSDTSQKQTVPGTYDIPNDERDGGAIQFEFTGLVRPLSIDLVDICPSSGQTATVLLTDEAGLTRTYNVPDGFTNDIAVQGAPGVMTLDLQTRDPQPGANATATSVEDGGYDPARVQTLEVHLGGSGAVDSLRLLETPQSLLPARSYAVKNTEDLLTADWNGDGFLDFAVSEFRGTTLRVFLNRGDGTFPPPTEIEIGPPGVVFRLASEDFNGDGAVDLALSQGAQLHVLMNRGDGSFDAPAAYAVPSGAGYLESIDVDGDLLPDLITTTASRSSGRTSVLINQGDGTFAATVSYFVAGDIRGMRAADIDGDGRAEFAVITRFGGARIWHNLGDGTFGPITSLRPSGNPTGSLFVDLNGDGFPEYIVLHDFGGLSLFMNPGDGTFDGETFIPLRRSFPGAITAGDVDGDGNQDLAVAIQGGNFFNPALILILTGRGEGTFKPQQPAVRGHGNIDFLALADLDGNGRPELLLSQPNDAVTILKQEASGRFHNRVDFGAGEVGISLAAADLNGDSVPDLVTTRSDSDSVAVYLNSGSGTFALAATYASGVDPDAVVLSDLNADGAPDMVIANTGENAVSVLLNEDQQTGSFLPRVAYSTAGAVAGVEVADLDGDGAPDLALSVISPASIQVMRNQGDGIFLPHFSLPGFSPSSMVLADLNGDSFLDLAGALETSDSILVLFNDGLGNLEQHGEFPSGGSLPSFLAALDADGDGDQDLLVANAGGPASEVSLLENDGGGNFTRTSGYSVPEVPGRISTRDIDNDGLMDFAVAGIGVPLVSVFYNGGDGQFLRQEEYATRGPASGPSSFPPFFGGSVFGMVFADFNDDQGLDLVVTTAEERFSLFLREPSSSFGLPNTGRPKSQSRPLPHPATGPQTR